MASYGGEMVPVSAAGSGPVSPINFAKMYPVYQIDFQAVAAGKRIATTKRRIRWRFGYPNVRALEEGLTGTACRGEEHDVTIVWSITSGKREVSMDGREVHFSTNRSGILEFSWSTRGNHVIKILAHAAPPLSAVPGFRQYDLWIDGQSFFTMPKVYELGLKGPPGARARIPGRFDYPVDTGGRPQGGRMYDLDRGAYVEPRTREQEEADLQRAINESIEESRRHLEKPLSSNHIEAPPAPVPAPAPTYESNLLDFGAPAPPPPASYYDAQSVTSGSSFPPIGNAPTYQSVQTAPAYGGYSVGPPQTQPYLALPAPPGAMSPDAASVTSAPIYGSGYAPAPTPPAYGHAPPVYASPPPVQSPGYYNAGPPPPQYSAPAPAYSYENSYAPAPAEDPFAAQYGQQPLPPADDPFAPKPPPPPTPNDITASILHAYSSPPPATPGHAGAGGSAFQSPLAPGQGFSLENGAQNGGPLSMNGFADTAEPEPTDEIARALKKLVNIDRIDEPAEQEIKLTLKKEEDKKALKKGKSKPLPPAATGLVGSQASLNQIKQVKPDIPKKTDGIMNQPPQLFSPHAVQAGALVIYGQSPPPGPPQGYAPGPYGPGYGQPPPPQYYQQPPPQGYYQQPPPPQYQNY